MTRVLIADDDPWILRMVANVLSKRGYEVESAHDGEEAFEKAMANKPDLLITDVMMPRMDGWTLVKALRSRPGTAFLPVIFLTALSSDDDRIRGFRLGADDYMAKPFRFEELDLRVERTLARGRMVEQVAREQLGAADPPARAPAPEAVPTEVEGSGPHVGLLGRLEQVGVAALLTLLEMERKSGTLVVIKDGGPKRDRSQPVGPIARITLRRGKVINARLENIATPANEDCIYHLLGWSAGSFEFNEGDVDGPDEIDGSTSHLLIEGARRIDEGLYETDDGWK
ncbi:MAG TPA: response regulator [Kofleriaceae bacterium]|nr:response regulator [Kofleriaceae bacterium]